MALVVQGDASVTTYTYTRGNLYDMVMVNGIKFALFHKPLQSAEGSRDLTITATDCNCVFLAPIEAEGDIIIKAVNVLVLNSLSPKGKTLIHAENFYGIGAQVKGDVLIETTRNALTLGLHGSVDTLRVKAGDSAFVHAGMDPRILEIVTEIKTLCAEGIQHADGLQLARGLLKAAVVLNDQHGKEAAVPALTFDPLQALPEAKS